jgi:hypothetical protein
MRLFRKLLEIGTSAPLALCRAPAAVTRGINDVFGGFRDRWRAASHGGDDPDWFRQLEQDFDIVLFNEADK